MLAIKMHGKLQNQIL